ncbi:MULTISPECIES: geranylgeranyl reductase family protein [Pseudonocardia]|uniref:Geranylgeranyl reductase family protein n=1 Tax=Pseudonocardia alni subsp. carboxydivorans TaxID=415010 RepID=A0ABU9AGY4_PSEA5|nr:MULTISPECIES: geranylgeranyl reductase family protein [Pseudonocardia]MBO4238991.1 geranylgeranyl reductase family protein [Pseudonocardia alni]
MSTYDVVVVGAGPAGCAAALNVLRLRPSASVLLLDAAAFPRDKTCGDGVAAEVFDLLDELGATGVRALGVAAPRLRLRTPQGRVAHRTAPRPNRVVTRLELDAALVDAAVAAGAQLRRHRVRTVVPHGDRVLLDDDVVARVVIGADGAHSVVRRALGAPGVPPSSTAVAIRGYTPVAAEPGTLSIEYAGGAVPAYAWSFPIAGGGANVGYGVFDERGAGNRASLLERLAALLPGQEPDPSTLRAHHLPLSTAPRFQPDGRVLLAGDAAAKVNPLTGEGIFDAVASGILAGRSALRGDDAGAAHRAAMERTFARHHRHVGTLARLAARPAFLDAAIGAAARSRRVFDCAVGLGLARGTVSPAALAVVAAHLPGAALGGAARRRAAARSGV